MKLSKKLKEFKTHLEPDKMLHNELDKIISNAEELEKTIDYYVKIINLHVKDITIKKE